MSPREYPPHGVRCSCALCVARNSNTAKADERPTRKREALALFHDALNHTRKAWQRRRQLK